MILPSTHFGHDRNFLFFNVIFLYKRTARTRRFDEAKSDTPRNHFGGHAAREPNAVLPSSLGIMYLDPKLLLHKNGERTTVNSESERQGDAPEKCSH